MVLRTGFETNGCFATYLGEKRMLLYFKFNIEVVEGECICIFDLFQGQNFYKF